MKPKDPQKERLIFKATLELVLENGLAGLTMAAVAKKTGLGMGTVYTYFKSKEELLNSLYRRVKAEHTNRILAGVDAAVPFPITLKKVWISYMTDRLAHYEEHFFIEQCMNSHFLDQESMAAEQQTFLLFHQILDHGKNQLLVKNVDNAVLTAHLVGSVNELANLVRQQGRKLDPALVDTGFALAWDSIKR